MCWAAVRGRAARCSARMGGHCARGIQFSAQRTPFDDKKALCADRKTVCADHSVLCADKKMSCADHLIPCADREMLCADQWIRLFGPKMRCDGLGSVRNAFGKRCGVARVPIASRSRPSAWSRTRTTVIADLARPRWARLRAVPCAQAARPRAGSVRPARGPST